MSTLQSLNPATGETLGTLPITATEQIPTIVENSKQAQKQWAAMSMDERSKRIVQGCKSLLQDAASLGKLLTQEMGKPLSSAIGEVEGCGKHIDEEIAQIRTALQGEVLEKNGVRTTFYRDPYGVCAAITPWNFPIAMPHWMCLPALMAGNSVVLKPSEETPLIAQAYVDALNKYLPPHVLQIIHGADEQGKALVASKIDFIAFTGSREVGTRILAASAPSLTRVILELGGKDPMLILPGSDLQKMAKIAAGNSFRNSGQVCVSTERIYIQKKDANEFVDALSKAAVQYTMGCGLDPLTRIGPMINAKQKDHVLAQIQDALKAGAKLCYGGQKHHGNFIEPTVLRSVTHKMGIAIEETFGPVAVVIEVESIEEAIALANDTIYGLGAVVYGPEKEALAVARQLTAGMIGVNKSCSGCEGSPWVGAQESGYGFHSGVEGHRQFTQLRLISTPVA